MVCMVGHSSGKVPSGSWANQLYSLVLLIAKVTLYDLHVHQQVTRKDAVLTKCFHVFCFDCLRTRYETRQRKCPKCNAAFGANDYHRLYLS